MNLSAQSDVAGASHWSRWDQVRLRLIVPIGMIVGIAIICLVIVILVSARRADEASLKRDQQLIQHALEGRGARVLRELESVAA
ncbi:MAG: hypothetical protein WBW06_05965, partial [Xanthobacteraceae bacterium]